jgi:hypothetical protein
MARGQQTQGEPAIGRPRVVELARNIHRIEMQTPSVDWHQDFLLSSDRHTDSPSSDRKLQARHLDEARRRGALVLDFGDLFDAMQGREDKRRARGGGLSADVERSAYFNNVVDSLAEFYAPYADLFGLVTLGNHEWAVREKSDIDLTRMWAEKMRHETGQPIHVGGYGGWIILSVGYGSTCRCTLLMHYFHGSGGGGMMSFDTLRVRRNASYMPDANIVVGGHVHEGWHLALARERLKTQNGVYRVDRDIQHHVRTGTYKDEYKDGHGGWAVNSGHPPKPKGAVWMRLRLDREDAKQLNRLRIVPSFELAVC